MTYYNQLVAMIFVGFLAVGYVYFLATSRQRATAPRDAQLEAAGSTA